MEKRKLMSLGKTSLVIAIPKHWLKKSSLEKGDFVFLDTHSDGSLLIHPETTSKKNNKITLPIMVDDNGSSILRRIIGCYLNGFSTIVLQSNKIFSVEQHLATREAVRLLYMRIMESDSSKIVIQTLLDESMGSVSSGVNRMHMITRSMSEDVLNSLKNWDAKLASSVIALEDDVDQFMYFILRMIRLASQDSLLARNLELDMLDCLDFQTFVHRIEHVADHLTNIAQNLMTLIEGKMVVPPGILSVIIEAAELAFDSYDLSFQSFLEKNVEQVDSIIENQTVIIELGELITPIPFSGNLEEKAAACPICAIRESVKRISEYSADIAELTIDRVYKK